MYQRIMSMQDKQLRTGAPLTAEAPHEPSNHSVSGQLPLAGKRITFRYWLGAIVLGAAIWAGIAVAMGLI